MTKMFPKPAPNPTLIGVGSAGTSSGETAFSYQTLCGLRDLVEAYVAPKGPQQCKRCHASAICSGSTVMHSSVSEVQCSLPYQVMQTKGLRIATNARWYIGNRQNSQ